MSNKTASLILFGACTVSTLVGCAGGYFIAKKKFDAQLDLGIAVEAAKAKKHYSILLQELRSGKPEQIPVIEEEIPEPIDDEEVEAEREDTFNRAKTALTNYQAYDKPPLEQVASNIFTNHANGKKVFPPRGPDGKFLPKGTMESAQSADDPYLIEPDVFLANTPEYLQESLLYFVKEKTALMVADNEPVDVDLIGEVNLTLFPDDDIPSVIYVRNEGAEIDYQITRTYDSLTEYMGLGEADPDDDNDDDTLGDFAEEGDLRLQR